MTQGSISFKCQCQTMTHNKHTTFFSIYAQSAIQLLYEYEFKQMSCKGYVASYSHSHFQLQSTRSQELISSTWQRSTHQRLGTGSNLYRPSTCSRAPIPKMPGDPFAHSTVVKKRLLNVSHDNRGFSLNKTVYISITV